MTVFLVGGGVDTLRTPDLLDPFRREADLHARRRDRRPRLAVVLVDVEGSGEHFLPAYVEALAADGACEVVPLFVRPGKAVERGAFDDVDGIAVGGGPTPAYLDGLGPAGAAVHEQVASGVPYVGFSAGAMIASRSALVGGYRLDGREVCHEDWSEGIEPLTIRPGLGLVPFIVDVHTAQGGTLGRTTALVEAGEVPDAVGIDEDTCLAVPDAHAGPDHCVVSGGGAAWVIRGSGATRGAVVTRRT